MYEAGLTIFLNTIIRSTTHPIREHLLSAILSQIQLDRNGETIQRSTVRECVDIFLRLAAVGPGGEETVYALDLEPVVLSASTEYYTQEATELLDRGDALAYLRTVSLMIDLLGII
jgi:cullin 3